jgi:uncharacterized protein
MKIAVDRLTETQCEFAFDGDSAWWRSSVAGSAGLPADLPEPLHFTCRAHCMGEDLYLEGEVEGRVELECGRCLKRYGHLLRDGFRLVLEPARNRVPADPEGAEALARDGLYLGDELDAGWYRGKKIQLGAVFTELVALALPAKPLCGEDCVGLCPRCGADLAAEPCDCEQTDSNSPFAVLASIREELTKGRS